MKIKATAIGLATFTLKRSGNFIIRTTGQHHCGTSERLAIQYRLEVRCTADSLDERGFLFDQTRVDQWFQTQTATDLSCEAYTIYCGRQLYKLIRAENAKCHIQRFTLTLTPHPYKAELTFCYGPNQ